MTLRGRTRASGPACGPVCCPCLIRGSEREFDVLGTSGSDFELRRKAQDSGLRRQDEVPRSTSSTRLARAWTSYTRATAVCVQPVHPVQSILILTKSYWRSTPPIVKKGTYESWSCAEAWTRWTRACSHYSQPIDDDCEVDEGDEHEIELLEAGEDSSKALQSTEQPLDLVAPLVHNAVVFPRRHPSLFGRNDRDETKIEGELPSLVTFVRSVHDQMQRSQGLTELAQQLTPLRRVMRLAG